MASALHVCNLLAAWREAEALAHQAEMRLYRAYVDFARNAGPEPSRELEHEAFRLRADAQSRYATAMTAVELAAAQADYATARTAWPRDPRSARGNDSHP